jgi:DNA topoisomerase-1
MVMRSKRGGRFIGCEGYPECNFSLPLPRSGQVVVTDRFCDEHGMYHIRIINAGKRPWNLGCPQCNFLEWQKSREEEKEKEGGNRERPKSINDINGIGKVTAEKLADAGICSVDELCAADALELAKVTSIPIKKIKNWQSEIA